SCDGVSSSASSWRGCEKVSGWSVSGRIWPLILMRIGVFAERYTSDAALSAISRSTRSMLPLPLLIVRFPLLSLSIAAASGAQQLVDAGLGAGLRVHALDDHRAGQAVGAAVARQRSGDDHRAGWHAPVAGLPGGAVVDRRALADEHAHRDHRVLLDDHA